jgi:GGDEF domain-containing protein
VALALGERLEQAIRVPLIVGGVEHGLSASIGIALGHSDADSLLRDADAASYRAKSGGGGRVELAIRP